MNITCSYLNILYWNKSDSMMRYAKTNYITQTLSRVMLEMINRYGHGRHVLGLETKDRAPSGDMTWYLV